LSNGFLVSRATYRYGERSRETRYFDSNSEPFAKAIAVLDGKGNEIRLTYFARDDRRLVEEAPLDIQYESFDAEGNWTRRLTTRWYGVEGRGKTFPEYVEYRTISYHTTPL
jgi:hypothetical protein